jgi:hypothetical protein
VSAFTPIVPNKSDLVVLCRILAGCASHVGASMTQGFTVAAFEGAREVTVFWNIWRNRNQGFMIAI